MQNGVIKFDECVCWGRHKLPAENCNCLDGYYNPNLISRTQIPQDCERNKLILLTLKPVIIDVNPVKILRINVSPAQVTCFENNI